MRILLMAWFIAVPVFAGTGPVFRFHLFTEPMVLDPQNTSSASGNYVFHNLYRGLYSYRGAKGLKKEGAKSCQSRARRLTCQLSEKHRWSDGRRIQAHDYVRSFRRLINPKNGSPQVDVIFALKNARDIWAGKKTSDLLGIRAKNEFTLEFEFDEDDPEFEFRLIHPALSPEPPNGFPARDRATELVTSGPYVISGWKKGHSIQMKPNPFYDGSSTRPDLETFFVDEDSTALRLYESGKINFLRRVVAAEIPRLKNRPDFHQFAMARFDYVGFGPALLDDAQLREAMVTGLDHQSFLELFDTRSPPGCPSLPSSYYGKIECLKLNPKARAMRETWPKNLEFHFSRMGGDDISRAAEWFQGQWKNRLGMQVNLKSIEQTVYLNSLRATPPAIFRKGVSLDRPTCLAGLEVFTKQHPENYIRLNDAKYEELVNRLRRPQSASARQSRCREALQYLMKTYRLIFLGEMHFTVMADRKFVGWHLNELNQLDLSQLRPASRP